MGCRLRSWITITTGHRICLFRITGICSICVTDFGGSLYPAHLAEAKHFFLLRTLGFSVSR